MPIPLTTRTSEPVEAIAQHLHSIHAEVKHKLALSNNEYKLDADAHFCHPKFEVGEFFMAQIYLERFPKKSFKKLHARGSGPFRITQKLGLNAYLVELPDIPMSLLFNVEDLVPYLGSFEPPALCSNVSAGTHHALVPPLPTVMAPNKVIDTIVDEQTVLALPGFVNRCLIHWKGYLDVNATWIIEE
ncbi:hypothetical protein K1719_043495 [Acacia pycnantha]|nr:hypothetical protein K1719_043495 [Acacia pycnantha]